MPQSGPESDFTVHVSKARRRARPWQAIIFLLLTIGAAVAVHLYGIPAPPKRANVTQEIITACGTVAFCVFGLVATFGFARRAKAILTPIIGVDYSAIVRFVLVLLGVIIVALTALSLLRIDLSKLILGGAITGVLLSIAAQQSLANLFAGVMLQIARPFGVGDRVRVRSGALAGTIEGTVMDFTITYIRLDTDEGRVFLPNSQVLAAAVSPVPRADYPPTDAVTGADAVCGADAVRGADEVGGALAVPDTGAGYGSQPGVAAESVRAGEAALAADTAAGQADGAHGGTAPEAAAPRHDGSAPAVGQPDPEPVSPRSDQK